MRMGDGRFVLEGGWVGTKGRPLKALERFGRRRWRLFPNAQSISKAKTGAPASRNRFISLFQVSSWLPSVAACAIS